MTINTHVFETLKENMGDILPILIDAFIEDGNVLLDEVKEGLASKNNQSVSTAVHTMKSSAKNIGAEQLALYCSEIEDIIEASPQSINEEKLFTLYQLASNEMKKVEVYLAEN